MADLTDGDRRELEWDQHYADCAECQSYEGDGTLEEALRHLCPEGRELAQAAIWAVATR